MPYDRNNGEPKLDLDQIQGDILVGLQKDAEAFIFFKIKEVPPFKAFLSHLATSELTTAQKALEREFQIKAQKMSGQKTRLNIIGATIGFTFAGLEVLGAPNLDKIEDESFKTGLAAQSKSLGDPTSGSGSPDQWKVGGDRQLDGVLTVTGPNAGAVDAKVRDLLKLAGTSWQVLFDEIGNTREDGRGHEHFGFLDGVSQPGIRGEIDHFFPKVKFLTEGQNPNNAGQGLPGSDLVWPGEFVFGYPAQSGQDVDEPDLEPDNNPAWMKNGSFMVYRRLNQLVPEFAKFISKQAETLDMDPDLLGARMVGRWKSGAPVSLSPIQDNTSQAKDKLLNNDFEFGNDAAGRRCPYAAHIRKTYPRDDITPAGQGEASDAERREASEADTQTHRILRRGIPFGKEVSSEESAQETTSQERGLAFVSFQTSIVDQFEFILRFWVNNPDFAQQDAGFDPILGQASGPNRSRDFLGATINYPSGARGAAIDIPEDFIVPTGGGYFFVPSIDTIKLVLT